MRLHYFDNFRAIAILIIIAGHCYGDWVRDAPWERAINSAVTGGTALFVFISGFFFQAIFARNFNYRRFLQKKFLAVGLPYLVLSLAFMAFTLMQTGLINFPVALAEERVQHNVLALISNLTVGRTLVAYWYIPFVLLLFIISPVVLRYMALWPQTKFALLVGCFVVAAFVHRPILNLNPLHSLLYFLPFYLLGVVYGENRKAVNDWLKDNVLLTALVWLLLVVGMNNFGQTGNAEVALPWQALGFDWMVPQKVALIGFILATLLRYGDRPMAVPGWIADMSFALFFLHPWVLKFTKSSTLMVQTESVFSFLYLTVLVTGLSVGLAVLVKRMMGARSRHIIGY